MLLSMAIAFALIVGAIAVALGVTGGWVAFVLAAILALPLLVDLAAARRVRGRGAGAEASDPPLPLAHIEPDDNRPLGDTAEAHDDLSPLDVPPESPVRRATERAAGARSSGRRAGS
jgi:hypothetical protein